MIWAVIGDSIIKFITYLILLESLCLVLIGGFIVLKFYVEELICEVRKCTNKRTK